MMLTPGEFGQAEGTLPGGKLLATVSAAILLPPQPNRRRPSNATPARWLVNALLIAATVVVTCEAASKKFPVSCDAARGTIVPWLEARRFRVTEDGSPKPGDVALKAKRPRSAEGKRIWSLQRYIRGSSGAVTAGGGCFESFDIVGVSAQLQFQPAPEGCAVSLVHRYLSYRGNSCSPSNPKYEPLVEARSNSKLEGEYLAALQRSLGELPEPPAPARSSRPVDRERQVLFVPDPSIPRPLPLLRTQDVQADLAGKPLSVVDVAGHERASQTPVVVVLDFANTSFQNHACLAAELVPLLDKIGSGADFRVFVTGGAISPFFDADFGIAHRPPMLLFSYATPDDAIQKCLSSYSLDEPSAQVLRSFLGYESRFLLSDLGFALSAHPGPYRVFWISDSFRWVDPRLALIKDIDTQTDDEHPFEEVPPTVSGFVENLSEAGVTIFPVLLPQRSRRAEQTHTSGFERSAAKYLADLTGGFVTVSGPAPGRTLQRLLAASDDGYVFRLRAPVTGRRFWDGKPHTLNLADHAASLTFHRGLIVSAEGSVESSEEALDREERLFVPSRDIRLVAGCPGHSRDKSVALFLPQQVLSAPESNLHVLVSYVPNSGAVLKQRVDLARPQVGPSQNDSSPVCFDLQRTKTGTRFSLVAFDEGTQWLGALNGAIQR